MNFFLKEIDIIDFTRLLPGPKGTHLLAQMGASVTKIEHPKRKDYARFANQQIEGASRLFHQLNHNKKIINIEYDTNAGKTKIYDLIKNADVLIEQFRPGAMKSWELDYESVKTINPTIVYVSLTGYQSNTDYGSEAGHDLNYLAYSGVLSQITDCEGKPVVPAVQFADISSAYVLAMAVQAGIIQKLKTGKGCNINVPIVNTISPFLSIPYALYKDGLNNNQFNVFNGKSFVNYAVYKCADKKWISLAAYELKFWNNFCDLVEKPEWKTNNLLHLSVQNFDKKLIEVLFLTKTRNEWINLFKGKDVCIAPVLALTEIEDHPIHQQHHTFEDFKVGEQTLKDFALPFKIQPKL